MAVMEVADRAAARREISRRRGAQPGADQSSAASVMASRALLHAYHRQGDLEARQMLIQQYLPLVRRLARQHAGRGEQLEDLVQVGSIGLINAIDRFELDRGVDLAAYAIPSIVGEIKRHLRDRVGPIRIPRRLQEVNASLRASAAGLAATLERPATIAEVARAAGVERDAALEALVAQRAHEPLSLSQDANGNGDGVGLEAKVSTEGGYEEGEDRALLARGFRALDQRERRLLHLAFFAGMSQARIAREVGISQIHVSRLTRRALEKLRDRDRLGLKSVRRQVPYVLFVAPGRRIWTREQEEVVKRYSSAVDRYLDLPYHITLVQDGEESGGKWIASAEELPDCTSRADTAEEAIGGLKDAMAVWVSAALKEGRDIPEPRSEATHSGRLLLRMPRTLHAALTKAAERENVSLNQFITDSLASVVGWRRGPTAGEAGSAPAPINQEPGAAGLTATPLSGSPRRAPRRSLRVRPRLLTAALTANFLLVAIAGTIAILVLIAARP